MSDEIRKDIEEKVALLTSACSSASYWITPEDALRDIRLSLDTLVTVSRRYPLSDREMVIERQRLAELIWDVRRAEEKFKDFTRVVMLPGPLG